MKHLLLFTMPVLLLACNEPKPADLIVHNATIYTVDDGFTQAEAMAIVDGRIVAIGAEHQILNAYASRQVVDAKKMYIYPGFIDAHAHLLGYGIEKQRLDLTGTTSFEEVVQRIEAYAERTGATWILGRGWDQNDWENKEYPVNDTLNQLFPDHFIALKRVDGHAYLVNRNVLELAGVDGNTRVSGGEILLKSKVPTGILIDEAMNLVTAVVPAPNHKLKSEALRIAQRDCFEAGLTSVCDAGLSREDIGLIDSLHSEFLKIRVYAMYAASSDIMNSLDELKRLTERLTARSVKVYADGALGSRGAKLLAPYHDLPQHTGLTITQKDSIIQWAKACKSAGFQLNVHCIGDSANRMVLQAMAGVLGTSNDLRWRIEHAQVVHPDDRSLFAEFNILPSMQPTHATSDMYWAEERLGPDRIAHAYAFNSLKNQNGLIALGTDFPVEGISPLHTYYAAVTMKDQNGYPADGFNASEKLSREDALRGITIWAAIANFESDSKGSLESGKFADFVMLDQDIVHCSDESILKTNVMGTWINGEMVYEK